MRAHFRTEDFLSSVKSKISYTIIREGLYNESWPLYLGHFKPNDSRREIVIAGDGKISWTSISDLGHGTARILVDKEYETNNKNQTIFLSQRKTRTLEQLAQSLGRRTKVVSPQAYVEHYRDEHGMDEAFLQWWVTTYASLEAGHCQIQDSPLESLLPHAPQPLTALESIIK